MSGYPMPLNLMSLGSGGCGFWVTDRDAQSFVQNTTVRCKLTMQGLDEISVEGVIVYNYPHPYGAEIGKYIGIKFSEYERYKLSPLIDCLEKYVNEGKLKHGT